MKYSIQHSLYTSSKVEHYEMLKLNSVSEAPTNASVWRHNYVNDYAIVVVLPVIEPE
jgi:hypothetical protein